MLQGNPYETRFVVDERASNVRRGVEQQKRGGTAKDNRVMLTWWRPLLSSIRGLGLSLRRLQPADDKHSS